MLNFPFSGLDVCFSYITKKKLDICNVLLVSRLLGFNYFFSSFLFLFIFTLKFIGKFFKFNAHLTLRKRFQHNIFKIIVTWKKFKIIMATRVSDRISITLISKI